ncbi:MAG: DNA repair protein RecN [Anaerolineae bacterium]|nr:DNA repair protein RecN [Anaerolineae bacterium]
MVLKELHIEDFAIIDDLHLTLKPGLNILTGETGAGKSILIDAVTLLLGSRADLTAVRRGADCAQVEGMFELSSPSQASLGPLLSQEELEGDSPDTLWLSRELRTNGRSIARINGRVVSLSLMREIAETLIDIHGQSEHLSLLRTSEHGRLLDRFAGLEDLRGRVAKRFADLTAVRREIKELQQNERARIQRMDMLRFQVNEIRTAHLVSDEKDRLESEFLRLNNAEQLTSLAAAVMEILEDGTPEAPAVLDLLGRGQRMITALARIDADMGNQLGALSGIVYSVEDVAKVLRDYLGSIEFNPKRLSAVEDRLVVLRQLERKYGRNLTEVMAYADAAEAELRTLENSDEHGLELREQEAQLAQDFLLLSTELSQTRQTAAQILITGMESELEDLRMDGAQLGVDFSWQQAEDGLPVSPALPQNIVVTREGPQILDAKAVDRVAFDASGIERIEFLVAPNVGEGLKPLVRIASGGETSRLMLALKTVLSRADRTPTLIFDEIDQGIGGRIGAIVGKKLWRLTQGGEDAERVGHQVLCITHLPQLAGFGDVHFKVVKEVVHDRTVTRVVDLQQPERIEELAQMLGTRGSTAKQSAQELLEQAVALKKLPVGLE